MNEHVVLTGEEIAALRRSGFALAYRMLGSASDAEDVVQEGLLRVLRAGEREQRDRLADRFFAAADDGDLDELEQLLAHDVVLRADSGGKAPAIRRAVNGRTRVARLLANGLRARTHLREITSRREQVNGQPGAMFFDHDGRLASIVVLDILDEKVQTVSIIVNPDKMRHLGPVADLGALLRGRR